MSDPTRFYTGWLLDRSARAALLIRFPPRYESVVAHHVTLAFGDTRAVPPVGVVAEIVGEADDGVGVQALVVALNGTTARPDGGIAKGWASLARPTAVRLIPKA